MLKISNQLLKTEAESRGWKVTIVDEANGLLEYTLPDGRNFIMYSLNGPLTPAVSTRITSNKQLLFKVVQNLAVRTPASVDVVNDEDAEKLLNAYGKIVIKPLDAAHGNGVTINIDNAQKLKVALAAAREYSDIVIAQEQVFGDDYRLLFIDGELAAAAIRKPASVVGDGTSTVAELIERENESGERAPDYQKPKNLIDVEAAKRYLGERMREVPSVGEDYQVVGTANIGTGGVSIDVTDKVTDEMIQHGKEVLKRVGLATGAVDYLGTPEKFWLLEVNANPSLGLHVYPAEGQSRPVQKLLLDWVDKRV